MAGLFAMREEVTGPELTAPAVGCAPQERRVAPAEGALGSQLEVTKVEDHDRQRGSLTARARQLARDLFLPRALVREPGDVVHLHGGLEPEQQRCALDHAGRLGGERLE